MFSRKKKEMPEDKLLMNRIIDKFLERDDIELLISPKSDEYFLIDKVNEIYLIILYDKIGISNHKFTVNKFTGLSFNEECKKKVRNRIEDERQKLKQMLFKNETELLKSIEEII